MDIVLHIVLVYIRRPILHVVSSLTYSLTFYDYARPVTVLRPTCFIRFGWL